MNGRDVDWPSEIARPELPSGYEWVCLRQALGVETASGDHPWYVRVRWTTRNGRRRFVRGVDGHFETPQEAISQALIAVGLHARTRPL